MLGVASQAVDLRLTGETRLLAGGGEYTWDLLCELLHVGICSARADYAYLTDQYVVELWQFVQREAP